MKGLIASIWNFASLIYTSIGNLAISGFEPPSHERKFFSQNPKLGPINYLKISTIKKLWSA